METFAEYQNQPASEKVGLVVMEVARRLVGWSLYSGATYRAALTEQVIVAVTASGSALSLGASRDSLAVGNYYHDRQNGMLYVRLSDDSDPEASFIALTFSLFFSNVPVAAPHDLADGFEVPWIPLLDPKSSTFTVEIETSQQYLGVAIASPSSLRFFNDADFWSPLYAKLSFESHRVNVYSWNRALPITEAKRIYRGIVTKKKFSSKNIQFEIKDLIDGLKSTVPLALMQDYVGASIPDSLTAARQRRLYGFVYGHVPTPIDQVLSTGYELTGTFTVDSGGTAVTGTGTSFLTELTPGDDIQLGNYLGKSKIESISSNTALVLSEGFPGIDQVDVEGHVFPSHPKRYTNRSFLVAGHAQARPSTTVTVAIDATHFVVASTAGWNEGDVIEHNGSQAAIRVLGDGLVKLSSPLAVAPLVGETVYLSSVASVYINDEPLRLTRDFTYDAANGLIALTPTAEFNIARPRDLTGTITLSNGSRNVSGSGTAFRTELEPGDWIRNADTTGWYEILEVTDDENLILRSACAPADAGAGVDGQRKHPNVYDQGSSVLSCTALGKKDEDGNFITTAAEAARDLLSDAGLADDLNLSTFSTGAALAPERIGFAIPDKFNSKTTPSIRDSLNKVCRSVFASIVQNEDFQLEFSVIDPSFSGEPPSLEESDIIAFSAESDASQLVLTAQSNYRMREYDPFGKGPANSVSEYTSQQYLTDTERVYATDTVLTEEEDAQILASRWAFLLNSPTTTIQIQTGLKTARLQVNDVVKISHQKLFERYGSEDKNLIGAILSVKKTVSGVTILVSDLGNAFARVARVAPDDQADYDEASEEERLLYGFQTDGNGLTDGEPGLNLIW